MKSKQAFIPYKQIEFSEQEMLDRATHFHHLMEKRRSVRFFSERDVPIEIINTLIRTASTAPSGAHKQPWTFCIIRSKDLKHTIRLLAEEEEKRNYASRMSDRWKKDLEPMGTNAIKEFIDIAPWIVVVMKKRMN